MDTNKKVQDWIKQLKEDIIDLGKTKLKLRGGIKASETAIIEIEGEIEKAKSFVLAMEESNNRQ